MEFLWFRRSIFRQVLSLPTGSAAKKYHLLLIGAEMRGPPEGAEKIARRNAFEFDELRSRVLIHFDVKNGSKEELHEPLWL